MRATLLSFVLLISILSPTNAQRGRGTPQYPADDPVSVGPDWLNTFQPSPAPDPVKSDKQYDPSISGQLDLILLKSNIVGAGNVKQNVYMLGIPVGIPTSPKRNFYRFNARIVANSAATSKTTLKPPFITAVYPGRVLSSDNVTKGHEIDGTIQPSVSGFSVLSLALKLTKSTEYTNELKLVQGDPDPQRNLVSWDLTKQDGAPIDTGLHEYFVAVTCPAEWSGTFSAKCMLTDQQKKAEKGKDMKHKWFTATQPVSTKDVTKLDDFIIQHLSLELWAADLFKAYQDALKGDVPAPVKKSAPPTKAPGTPSAPTKKKK